MSKTSLINFISKRTISLSATLEGKRNFRKFIIPNKRGTRIQKKIQASADPEMEVDKRGVRDTGYILDGRFVKVPEMIPEFIVPDLTDFELKPYVSYRVEDITQTEFTAQQLFDAVYSKKIVTDFKEGKLNEKGDPIEPSEEELLQPEEAIKRARKTGSDLL